MQPPALIIDEDSSERAVFRTAPAVTVRAMAIATGVLAAFALAIFFAVVQNDHVTVECERARGTCVVAHGYVLASTEEVPIATLRGASIQKRWWAAAHGARHLRYQLVLEAGGRLVEASELVSYDDARSASERLSAFLASPSQPRVEVTTGGNGVLVFPVVAGVLASLWLLVRPGRRLWKQAMVVTLDRRARTVSMRGGARPTRIDLSGAHAVELTPGDPAQVELVGAGERHAVTFPVPRADAETAAALFGSLVARR